ncbi:MFS transporter [Actinomadura sp. KC06]|uniref:MFS transporter n=1 Tax=Actinomadura sp. KC06 TaxID=2530369 RepID=UPI00104F0CBA|nr:MFS transporter [Actinomadura sp. KC06]TDD30905.1 MFS transporter [Actinomadura sp. KC06]
MFTTETHSRAGRREWTGLAVLVLANLLISMDVSVLYLAVPFISADLDPSASQQLWILDIYGFLLAGLLITMGALGDRFGRRRLLLCGAAAFGAASVAAAYADSAGMLIGARAALGVAGAVLAPSTLALIRTMFTDPVQRRTAIAAWTAGFSGGAAIGPLVSGVLLDHFWWGSVFLINVPPMVLLLVLAPFLIPEYRAPRPGRFGALGAVLSLATVLPVIYGIKELAQDGVAAAPVLYVAAGAAAGVLFLRHQRRRPDAMIDTGLFRLRAFSTSIAVDLVALFAMVGFALFTTQWLQLVHGMGPLEAALWSLPAPLSVGVATTVAAALARTLPPARIIGGGLLISAAGFVLLTRVAVDSPLALVVVGATAVAAGLGVGLTLTADLILGAAPPERAGAVSALAATGNQLGGALGVAMLGSVGAAFYRHGIDGAVPAGAPPEAAATAGETLSGAVEVAGRLPEQPRAELLDAAREAFVQGMAANAVIGAVVMAATAVAAFVLLRDQTAPAAPAASAAAVPEATPATAAAAAEPQDHPAG